MPPKSSRLRRQKTRRQSDKREQRRSVSSGGRVVPYLALAGEVGDWRAAWVWVGGVWLVSRVVLTAVGVFARATFERSQGVGNVQAHFGIGTGQPWLDIWSAWDSRWYYHIAEHGYQTAADSVGYVNYAFFPLYPWLARIAGWPFGDGGHYLGGLLVSNLALLIGAGVLYRWMEQEKDRATARKAVLFLMLFPTGYVFSALMSESLFFALSVGAYYFARRDNWWLASLLGGLSAMTRSLGLLMAPLLAWEYLRRRYSCSPPPFPPLLSVRAVRRAFSVLDARVLWLGLAPLGLVVFMAVCWRVTGDPLAFLAAQEAWSSGRLWSGPVAALTFGFKSLFIDGGANPLSLRFGLAYGAFISLFVLLALVIGRKQIGVPLLLWSLVLILFPLSSSLTSTLSMPRYAAVIFPLFVIFAALPMRAWYFWALAGALALTQMVNWSMWTLAYHVGM